MQSSQLFYSNETHRIIIRNHLLEGKHQTAERLWQPLSTVISSDCGPTKAEGSTSKGHLAVPYNFTVIKYYFKIEPSHTKPLFACVRYF